MFIIIIIIVIITTVIIIIIFIKKKNIFFMAEKVHKKFLSNFGIEFIETFLSFQIFK